MSRRTLIALACACALVAGGCEDADAPPAAQVGLSLAQELDELATQLDGAAAVLPPDEPAVADHVAELWGRAVRADVEVRRRLELAAPGGEALRRAASAAIRAAEELHTAAAADKPASPATRRELEAARSALGDAATALDPGLPPAADAQLEALRPR